MSDNQKNPEKSISDQLSELLPQLSRDQLRFVAAMQEYPTKREAAEAIDLKPDTVYRWPAIVDEVILLAARNREAMTRQIAERNLMKAMLVKVAGLDSDDEPLRQKVATEIIEWSLGKATQRQELTGANGGPVELAVKEVIVKLHE